MTETTGEQPDETPAPAAEPSAPPSPEPTPAPPVAPEATASPAKSADERKAILDRRLEGTAAQGWRIENRSDFQATIAKGKPVHHLLHLILTIVTLGAWLIVWLLVTIFGGVKRRLLSVDEYGNIADRKI